MELMMQSFARAMRSLLAPGMITLFIWSVVLTLVTLLVFIGGATSAAGWLFSGTEYGWLTWLAGAGSFMFAWFLFPGIMPVIVNFFDVRIAGLIEKQDYPAVTPLANPPFWPELWHDLRFSFFVIIVNILMIPVYFIPLVNALVFYGMNGYLLGKEFFIMTARRHIAVGEAKALWQTKNRSITLGGIGLAVMATIPLLNLFAPFWGIAVMTHIYHAIKTPKVEILPPR